MRALNLPSSVSQESTFRFSKIRMLIVGPTERMPPKRPMNTLASSTELSAGRFGSDILAVASLECGRDRPRAPRADEWSRGGNLVGKHRRTFSRTRGLYLQHLHATGVNSRPARARHPATRARHPRITRHAYPIRPSRRRVVPPRAPPPPREVHARPRRRRRRGEQPPHPQLALALLQQNRHDVVAPRDLDHLRGVALHALAVASHDVHRLDVDAVVHAQKLRVDVQLDAVFPVIIPADAMASVLFLTEFRPPEHERVLRAAVLAPLEVVHDHAVRFRPARDEIRGPGESMLRREETHLREQDVLSRASLPREMLELRPLLLERSRVLLERRAFFVVLRLLLGRLPRRLPGDVKAFEQRVHARPQRSFRPPVLRPHRLRVEGPSFKATSGWS
eukprot:31011-Pelagococcus_subviridis.AAC.7